MRKILCALLCAVFLMIPLSTVAVGWDNPNVSTSSLYQVEVIKLDMYRDSFGNAAFKMASTVERGDYVYFVPKLTIPTHKDLIDKYGFDPGDAGCPFNITIKDITLLQDGAQHTLSGTVPRATTTTQTLYFGYDGRWSQAIDGAKVWPGVANGTPGVTASVDYNYDLKNIRIGYQAKEYRVSEIVGGFQFTDGNTALNIYTDNTGKATSVVLMIGSSGHRLYQTMTGYAVDGESYVGEYTGILMQYFSALNMTAQDFFSGRLYVTANLIRANFGPLISTRAVADWGTPASLITTLPVTTMPSVPATGDYTAFYALSWFCAFILALCVMRVKRHGYKN